MLCVAIGCVAAGVPAQGLAQMMQQPSAPAEQPAKLAEPVAAQPTAPPSLVENPVAPPGEPTQEQRDKAREAYGRAQALFADGRFKEAEAAFAEAYAAVPNPVVLLGTAECDMRLGKLDDAYVTLQRYLKDRPDAPDRAEVEHKAADLLALPAVLVLSSEPVGAVIKLDGNDTGKRTPAELNVSRGDHTLEIVFAGYETATETVPARIGARHELHAVLKAIVAPEVAKPTSTAELEVRPEAHGSPATALWITSIVGAAGLVTGTVLGFMVLAERSDYDANPTAATAKSGERLALFTDVAFGVGAMALVTGAVLYFTADSAAEPNTAEHAASFRLAPSAFAHGGGLTARGRF